VPPQDLVAGRVQTGFRVALVDPEEDVDPVERRHRRDRDLIRVARAHTDDQQFTHVSYPPGP
jgi:hypothetical protein